MEIYNRYKIIIFAAIVLLFGIFLGKNSTSTPVWVFGWNPQLPLIVIALVCFLLGAFCTWLMMWWFRKHWDE